MLVLGLVDVPWWAILIIVFGAYAWYTTRHFDFFEKQGLPVQTKPWPIVGTMYRVFGKTFAERSLDNMELAKAKGKGCLGGFFGSAPSIEVYDEEMLSEIMVKQFSAFTNRMHIGSGSLQEHMLINLEDHSWKHARNGMTPTFTTGKLKKMNEEINRCARNLAESLSEPAKKGEIVEMKEYTGGYTMDVIASTAFGIRVDSQKDRNNAFVTHGKKAFEMNFKNPIVLIRLMSDTINQLLVKMGFPFDFIPKDTQDFFRDVTRQTMEMRRADTDKSRTDFLQLMINAQKGESIKDNEDEEDEENVPTKETGLTTDEILANALVFFVAGYDTTATSLSFFMYNMALNPESQDKLVEEINNVVGEKDQVDYNVLQEMPYLEQCVNENLRMYPPAIGTNRKTSRDITIKGVSLMKGMYVFISIYALHRDPARWPEPDKFIPERFSAENRKNRSPYDFMPFGNGPRNCIGLRLAMQELKMAVIYVLRSVRISKCDKTQIPMTYSNSAGGLLKSKGGIWVQVEQRTK